MAKHNNSLTELQALEGIYEHLSIIDDLAKEVGVISSRLRKIEDRMNEPVEITDPVIETINGKEFTRDLCIFGAMFRSDRAYKDLQIQKEILTDLISKLNDINKKIDAIMLEQAQASQCNQELKDNVIELSKPWWEKVFR